MAPSGNRLLSWLVGGTAHEQDVGDGVTMIRLSSRATRPMGMDVSIFTVGEILVDTGFSHVRGLVASLLADRSIGAIVLTHNHEDHSGNVAALVHRRGCPVYLRNAGALWHEGVDRLLPYRATFWGPPEPYQPQEMPLEVEVGRRRLRAIPTPGHSETHTAFFEEATGRVFTGDLYMNAGAAAVLRHENPYESVRSLRRVAALKPRRLITGHCHILDDPTRALETKANRIEEAAHRVLELQAAGLPVDEIVGRLFSSGRLRDLVFRIMTQGEFSRPNFVRACIRHRE
ncbi:MAG: MBL fold metallo-hydrolase [Candidatus Riflebacteria bacterium]|nr:MBL fold metallo-hydrolase [Candidatus Riflebacteria bacterium]